MPGPVFYAIPFTFPVSASPESFRLAGEHARSVLANLKPRSHFVAADDSTEVDSGRNPAPPNPVRERLDGVIKDLGDRLPSQPDRARLRKALDTADGPDTSRKEADKALGRVAARG